MCEGETAEKGKLETAVRGKVRMSGRKVFRIAVQVLRTVILSIALIILVLVGPLYLYRTVKNIQVKRLAREYLTDTYDFQWKFGKVE